jgi:uncharacterized protein (DUF169 family)
VGSYLRDYSIFERFNFERKPIGIKYLLKKPEGIERIDKALALCELFGEAQKIGRPFYTMTEDVGCGGQLLGMKEMPPFMYSGQLGQHFSMFKDANANRRVYEYLPKLAKDSVKYIIFSPVDQLTIDPDILFVTADATQAEILLRASSYSNGKMWSSRGTTCLSCAWLYVYPYLSGELNYTVTGFGYGMKARKVFPSGLIVLSIPFDVLKTIMDNLQEMEWDPEWFHMEQDAFIKNLNTLEEQMMREFSAE